jgi:hypothetical protein
MGSSEGLGSVSSLTRYEGPSSTGDRAADRVPPRVGVDRGLPARTPAARSRQEGGVVDPHTGRSGSGSWTLRQFETVTGGTWRFAACTE